MSCKPVVRRDDVVRVDAVADVGFEVLVTELDRAVCELDTWCEPRGKCCDGCLVDVERRSQRANAHRPGEREHQREPPLPAGIGAADLQG